VFGTPGFYERKTLEMRKKLLQLLIAVLLLVFIGYVGFFMFGILPLSFNLLTLITQYYMDQNIYIFSMKEIISTMTMD